jgi:hypothetical protein
LARNGRLNNFPFNSISSDSARIAVADALGGTPVGTLNAALSRSRVDKAVAEVLRHAGVKAGVDIDEDIDFLERGWNRWLIDSRAFDVQPYRKEYNLTVGLSHAPQPVGLQTDEGSKALWGLRTFLSDPHGRRSDVERELSRLAGSAEAAQDEVLLRTWTERVRHTAIAQQHSCSYSYLVRDSEPDMVDIEKSSHLRPTFELDPALLLDLGELESHAWHQFNRLAKDDLETWWRNSDARGLERAVKLLARTLADAQSSPWRKIALPLLGFVVASGIGAVGHDVENVSHGLLGASLGGGAGWLLEQARGEGETLFRRRHWNNRLRKALLL